MRLHTITVPIYKQTILFGVGNRQEYQGFILNKFNAVLDEDFFVFKGITDRYTDYRKNKAYHLMWINSEVPNKDWEQIFHHELFHLTYGVLDWCGVALSQEPEESFAYLHDYLFSQLKPLLNAKKQTKT